jgi:membrane protease subunit (stomatin/prohibitin family)
MVQFINLQEHKGLRNRVKTSLKILDYKYSSHNDY